MATLVEWFAGTLAFIVLAKLLMYIFISDKKLSSIAKSMVDNKIYRLTILVITVVLSWYVISAIGIISFAAAFLAVAGYYGYVLLSFPKEMRSLTKAVVKKRSILWPAWIYALVLAIWILKALFF